MDYPRVRMPHFSEVVAPYVQNGDREYLARVLQHWSPAIDPNHQIGEALHAAIFRGDETAVRMILDAGGSPKVQLQCDPGYTPLLTASQYGRFEIARLFWQLVGPDGRFYPSKRPQLTCLQVAARNGHMELVAYYLDVWNGWADDEKRRTLYDAASSWCDNVVALLLTKVHYEPETIQDALEHAVNRKMILPEEPTKPRCTAEDYDYQHRLVCRLIDAGANPDTTNNRTTRLLPLHMASLSGDCIGALRGLLEKGANADAQDSRSRTALHCLFSRAPSSSATLRILLHHHASSEIADQVGETPLHAVARTGTLDQFQLCLSHSREATVAINLQNSHGESLLHYAAAGGREDIVGFLLSHGLDVNLASSSGWTPLICALSPTGMKREHVIYRLSRLLLQRGASAQVVTDEGWTPLHALATWPIAYSRRDPEARKGAGPLAQELISRGAPIDTATKVIQSSSMTPEALMDVWGFRMQRFAKSDSITTQDQGSTDRDTTPLMWAKRGGATDIFEVVKAHLDSTLGVAGS